MESALIVTASEKSLAFFSDMLKQAVIDPFVTVSACSLARRLLMERDFDLVIINAPLKDESGEELARHIAQKGVSQVILVVAVEHFEQVSASLETEGVLTVAKPINKSAFWGALQLAKSAQHRFMRMQTENLKLKQTIEDIRIVDRAKCVLISYLNMGEKEAHRYIEKQAMDMRTSRRVIAERILKTYEN